MLLLHKDMALVGLAVTVSVLHHHDAVSLAITPGTSVVYPFCNPCPTLMIEIYIGGITEKRRLGPHRDFKVLRHHKSVYGHLGLFSSCRIPCSRFLVEDQEANAACLASLLTDSALVESPSCHESVITFRHVIDDRGRSMGSDSIGNRLPVHYHRLPTRTPVDLHASPSSEGRLPFQIRQLKGPLRTNQSRFCPVRPVTAVTVSGFVHHEEKGA